MRAAGHDRIGLVVRDADLVWLQPVADHGSAAFEKFRLRAAAEFHRRLYPALVLPAAAEGEMAGLDAGDAGREDHRPAIEQSGTGVIKKINLFTGRGLLFVKKSAIFRFKLSIGREENDLVKVRATSESVDYGDRHYDRVLLGHCRRGPCRSLTGVRACSIPIMKHRPCRSFTGLKRGRFLFGKQERFCDNGTEKPFRAVCGVAGYDAA